MFKISRKIIYMHFCLCKFCWAVYLVTGGHYSIRRLIILPVIFPPPCPALNSSIFFPVFLPCRKAGEIDLPNVWWGHRKSGKFWDAKKCADTQEPRRWRRWRQGEREGGACGHSGDRQQGDIQTRPDKQADWQTRTFHRSTCKQCKSSTDRFIIQGLLWLTFVYFVERVKHQAE